MRFLLSIQAGLVLTATALTACAAERFPASHWQVVSLDEHSEFAQGEATVTIDGKGGIAAYAGCNRMGGSYTLSANTITISPLMATMMACSPEQKMRDEAALATALEGTHDIVHQKRAVQFRKKDGAMIQLKSLK